MTLHRPKQRSRSCSPTYPLLTKCQKCRVDRNECGLNNLPQFSTNSYSSKLPDSLLIKGRCSDGCIQSPICPLTNPCAQDPDWTNTRHCSTGKRNNGFFCYNDGKAKVHPEPWHSSNPRMYNLKSAEDNRDTLYQSKLIKSPQFDANELKIYLKRCLSNRYTASWSEDDREMEERILNVLAASSGRHKIVDCLSQVQETCLYEDGDLLELIIRLKHCARGRFGGSTKTPVPQEKQIACLYCSIIPCRCGRVCQQCHQNPCTCFINAGSSLRGGHDRIRAHSDKPFKENTDVQRPNYSNLARTKHNRYYGQRDYRQPMIEWYDNNRRSSSHYRTTHQRDFPAENRLYICPTCYQQRWYKSDDNNILTKSHLTDVSNADFVDGPIGGLLPLRYRSPTKNFKAHDSDMDYKRQRYNKLI